MELIADTTFLVGLWRKQTWALQFASRESAATLGIPWVVFGEFWHGARRAGHDSGEVGRFLDLGQPLWETREVIPAYAEICMELQNGAKEIFHQIGQNDLWIAAVARIHDRPLVTRNARHFAAIQNLELVALQE